MIYIINIKHRQTENCNIQFWTFFVTTLSLSGLQFAETTVEPQGQLNIIHSFTTFLNVFSHHPALKTTENPHVAVYKTKVSDSGFI